MTVVLERLQRVKHDEVAHVEVRGGRVEAELHAELFAAIEPRAKVIRYVDLHRPLAQALEELRAHALNRPGRTRSKSVGWPAGLAQKC